MAQQEVSISLSASNPDGTVQAFPRGGQFEGVLTLITELDSISGGTSPAVNVKVQASNDGLHWTDLTGNQGNLQNPGDWVQLTDGSVFSLATLGHYRSFRVLSSATGAPSDYEASVTGQITWQD